MTQKDKELLLKDLYARSPYGVICQFIWTYSDETTGGKSVTAKKDDSIRCIDIHTKEIQADYYGEWVDLEHCKPYLRPISSMTKEEKAESNAITDEFGDNWFEATTPEERWKCAFLNSSNDIDWLNAHHFDYRGLIEKGLALEAPENIYG